MKDKGKVYLIWFFLCFVGGHRFYLGKPFTGLLQAFTFGGLGVWALIDLFLIPSMVANYNRRELNNSKKQDEPIRRRSMFSWLRKLIYCNTN